MSAKKTRIMYVERKTESLNGPARIGRVAYSKSGRTLKYEGRKFGKVKSGHFQTDPLPASETTSM
jgi:hypothetical protein